MTKKYLRKILPIQAKLEQKKGTELYYCADKSESLECWDVTSSKVQKYSSKLEEFLPYSSKVWEHYVWYRVYEVENEY